MGDRESSAERALNAGLQRLDDRQRAAVTTDLPAVFVRAPVGSGKTTVIAWRVAWLHLVRDVPLDRIAVLTFTTHAAGEIRARIEALAAGGVPLGDGNFWLLGTFHAVARTLLQRILPVERLGRRRGFRVIDEAGRAASWRRAIDEHGLDIKYPRKLGDRMAAWRRDGTVRMGNMKRDDDLARLHALCEADKRTRNLMDFDDLLETAAELLGDPAVRARVGLDGVVVDELQDCEPRELALLHRLVGAGTPIFAVGDPAQAIYGWRGGSAGLVARFAAQMRLAVVDLARNYRSTDAILKAAQAVLGLQTGLDGGRLLGTRGGGQPIAIDKAHNPTQEALMLAARCNSLHVRGVPWGQMAVFARTRAQLDPVRTALRSTGVPVCDRVRPDESEAPAALWLLSLLRAAAADDAVALRTVLTDAPYGPVPKRLLPVRGQALASISKLRHRLLDRTTRSAQRHGDAAAAAVGAGLCERLLQLPDVLAPRSPNLAQILAEHLDLAGILKPAGQHRERDRRHADRLIDDLAAAVRASNDAPAIAWTAALDRITLDGLHALRTDADPAPDAVHVMTLHASKGLEFAYVFIIGLNQGAIPPQRAWGNVEADAEERRLLYVGLTRARDAVTLSWVTNPDLPGAQPLPSQYLSALPADVARWDAAAQQLDIQQVDNQQDSASREWPPGQLVRHARYGHGTVLHSDATAVVVAFAAFGERSFGATLCPLVALDAAAG
jgi:DNA helicase-2/ATP-dependent DNA helicase PcrA